MKSKRLLFLTPALFVFMVCGGCRGNTASENDYSNIALSYLDSADKARAQGDSAGAAQWTEKAYRIAVARDVARNYIKQY